MRMGRECSTLESMSTGILCFSRHHQTDMSILRTQLWMKTEAISSSRQDAPDVYGLLANVGVEPRQRAESQRVGDSWRSYITRDCISM